MSEWFKEWFDTEEFLYVYKNRNDVDAGFLVNLILNNANIKSGGSVLDMACGSGRHSILLARKGFSVTAVDLSRNLLRVAKESAKEAGVNINFIRADLREFTINSKFNLAVNRVIKQIIINKNGSEKHYYESVRMYNRDELFSNLEEEGCMIRKYFGDSHG